MTSFQVEGPLHLESFPDKQCATYLSLTKEPAFFYRPIVLSTPTIINILGEKQDCSGSLFFIVRRSDDKTILSQKTLHFEGFMEQHLLLEPLNSQLDIGILCQNCEHKDTFDLLSLDLKDYIPPPPPPIPLQPIPKQTQTTQLEAMTRDLAQRMKQKKNDDDVTMKSIRIYKHLEVDIPSSHNLHTPDSQPREPLPDTTPPEQPHLDALQETQPEVPTETLPEAPIEVIPEAPIEVIPEAHMEVIPEAPIEVIPEAPIEVIPEAPIEVIPEAPIEVIPEAPIEVIPEAPIEVIPEAPIEVIPEAPIEVIPEAPIEVIPEVHKEARNHIKVVIDPPAQILKMDQSTDVLPPALSMDELKGRFSMRISQLYVSKALQVFGKRLLQRYSLSEYKNQQDSTIFYGCCTQQDYLSISQHKGLGIILWSGPDSMLVSRVPAFVDFLKKASNLYHIAYSAAIEKDLKDLGLRYLYLPVTPILQDKIFSPTKKGTAVYVYSQPTLSSFYKMDLIKKIQDKLPNIPFVFSTPPDPSLTQPILKNNIISAPYSFMPSFYENCFVGLRLTEHDGISCSVQEMALMGRKTIHNDSTPGCLTYTDEDSIIQAILEEQKTIGTSDYDLSHKTQQMIQEADFYILHLLSPISVLGRIFTLKWDGSHPSDYKWENIINPTSSLLIRQADHQWIIEFIQDHTVRIIGRIKNIDLLPPEHDGWTLTSLP